MDLESKYCYFYHSWDFVPYKQETSLIQRQTTFQALTEIGESVGPTTLGRDQALPCLILNQYNNKIPKAIITITNYRKPIPATYTRTKTRHKHRGICCLIHYSIILNLTTVNVPRIENIFVLICKRRPLLFGA